VCVGSAKRSAYCRKEHGQYSLEVTHQTEKDRSQQALCTERNMISYYESNAMCTELNDFPLVRRRLQNHEEMEITIREWYRIKEPNFQFEGIYKLQPRLDTRNNVFGG
jgi:hypothetical protein